MSEATSAAARLAMDLFQAVQGVNEWNTQAAIMAYKYSHTCKNSHLRDPFPWEPDCKGCRREMDRFVRRFRLEVPYALFGWDVLFAHYIATINHMSQMAEDRREARNQLGAFI